MVLQSVHPGLCSLSDGGQVNRDYIKGGAEGQGHPQQWLHPYTNPDPCRPRGRAELHPRLLQLPGFHFPKHWRRLSKNGSLTRIPLLSK